MARLRTRGGRSPARLVPRMGGGFALLEDALEEDFVNIETAGDDLVCEECQDAADDSPYTAEEAESLLPIHPNCRCAVIPAFDMRFSSNRMRFGGDE